MTSARTSLGEVRTRRRSRRAAGPSASARRAASSQNTGARAYQWSGPEAGHATRIYISTEAGWSKATWSYPSTRLRSGISCWPRASASLKTRSRVDRPSSDSHHRPMCSEAAGRHMLRRALAWSAALCAIGLGCLAALVGALDTRRVCVGILDATCDGPNWGEALVAFGLACALLTVGVVLVVRLRRGA
jgi:hypothetical protein